MNGFNRCVSELYHRAWKRECVNVVMILRATWPRNPCGRLLIRESLKQCHGVLSSLVTKRSFLLSVTWSPLSFFRLTAASLWLVCLATWNFLLHCTGNHSLANRLFVLFKHSSLTSVVAPDFPLALLQISFFFPFTSTPFAAHVFRSSQLYKLSHACKYYSIKSLNLYS